MRGTLVGRLACLAGAIAPAVASAQLAGKFVVTPYVGVYSPANSIAKIDVGSSTFGARLSAKHESSAAYGANLSYWLTNRFAFELGGAYTGSGLHASGAISDPMSNASGTGTEGAHVWLGSAKMMMQLLSPLSDFNMRLGFGPAIISRGGAAYRADADGRITGTTDLGAAVSLCTRLDFTRSLGVRVRVEDYIYQGRLGWRSANSAESFAFPEKMQHDFVISAGLQVFLNR